MKLSEMNANKGTPLIVTAPSRHFAEPESCEVHEGDAVQFCTRFMQGHGKVHSIDHGLTYPLQLEWFDHAGHKHITRFENDEFLAFRKAH